MAFFPFRILPLLVLTLVMLAIGRASHGQEKEFYDQEPFDRLTLTKASGGVVIKLVPLQLPSRVAPNPKPKSGKIRVKKFDEPAEEYDVNWVSIEKLEFFESMVLDRARQLIGARDFDRAFRYLAFLRTKYPATPGLKDAVHDFLYLNAGMMARSQPNRAFAILEELFRLNATYQFQGGSSVANAIDSIVSKLLEDYLQKKDYPSMRRMLQRLGRTYGDTRLPSLAKYRLELDRLAKGLLTRAQKLMADGNLRESYLVSREMLSIWPEVAGGAEFADDAARKYPIVRVGVLDESSEYDPSTIDNWASRRAGRLMVRLLTEYREAGPEGGEYHFPWGAYERSEDLRRLTLIVGRKAVTSGGQPLDGFQVARRLLDMANPDHPSYYSAWADLVAGVSVEAVYKVHIDLRRPSMIPESLLQVTLNAARDGESSPSRANGAYEIAEKKGDTLRFVRRPDYAFTGSTQPAEVIEKKFKGSQFAIQSLVDQDIDAIDRIYPALVPSVQNQPGLKVSPYETPTLHFLVPNLNKPYPASRTFRRALLYGIDRDRVLNSTLLENAENPGARVISGPFPAARDADDPLAYAYDEKVEPLPYFPQHAVLLLRLSEIEFNQIAERNDTKPPPKPTEIILAHPSGEQATLAAQAIAAQWNMLGGIVGFTCKLKPLPPGVGRDESGAWDFLYVEAMVREPVSDARRLLGFDGVAASDSDHLGQALRRLETAYNWKLLRGRLHDVHHRVFSELAVLPLYQVTDYCAYREGLRGVGDHPSAFYQNIEFWEIAPQPVD